MIAEDLWDKFMAQLNAERPLGKLGEHRSFLGSVEEYRNIFMRANEEHTKAGAFRKLLSDLETDALQMIADCNSETELNNVKSLLLGRNSFIKQIESTIWSKR